MEQSIGRRMRIENESSWSREQQALAWVRAHYPGWHTRFSEPFEAYLTRRPAWVPPACWSRWYEAPFRDRVLNEHVRIVRRLLGAKRTEPEKQPQPWHRPAGETFRGTFARIEPS